MLCVIFNEVFCVKSRARGSAVGWGTVPQAGWSRIRDPMVSLEFFIDVILPAALWSRRRIKCGRCIGLTILPPSCADFLEIWSSHPPEPWVPIQPLLYHYVLCKMTVFVIFLSCQGSVNMSLSVLWVTIRHKTILLTVVNLVHSYKALECNMPKKVHFWDSHLDFFPENFGAVSDEHGGRFHQDISTMEKRYQGKWGYPLCWLVIVGHLAETLHRQDIAGSHPLLRCR